MVAADRGALATRTLARHRAKRAQVGDKQRLGRPPRKGREARCNTGSIPEAAARHQFPHARAGGRVPAVARAAAGRLGYVGQGSDEEGVGKCRGEGRGCADHPEGEHGLDVVRQAGQMAATHFRQVQGRAEGQARTNIGMQVRSAGLGARLVLASRRGRAHKLAGLHKRAQKELLWETQGGRRAKK